MKTLKRTLVIALVLVLSGAAQAAQLFTPPLVPEDGRDLNCNIVNVGSRTKTVRILLLNVAGDVVKDTGNFDLNPGEVGFEFEDESLGPLYCKFIVEGRKKNYRASSCVFESGVGCISVVQAQ
jgi:hypothetical protein